MRKFNDDYLNGIKLYGDDFDLTSIEKWYKDEQEAYVNLDPKKEKKYNYTYHYLNILNGFNYLPPQVNFKNTLSLGGAWGHDRFNLCPAQFC